MALFSRVILTYNLDLVIPISQVNENMKRAQRRDAVRQEKFYFRVGDERRMMPIDEIINGVEQFPGLVPLVRQYLCDYEHFNGDIRLTIERYLVLISRRAGGIFLNNTGSDSALLIMFRNGSNKWKITQIANGHQSSPFYVEPDTKI